MIIKSNFNNNHFSPATPATPATMCFNIHIINNIQFFKMLQTVANVASD